MLALDGTWRENSTCTKCRQRHPAGWSCKYAGFVAGQNRKRMAARAIPNTANFFFRESQDPWEHFIKENYL